jgi:hypothetical protein
VDLAKDVFEVALANRAHRIIDRKRLTRRQFESFIEGLATGTAVVMEACGTAHYWGRRCQARGLVVRLIPVQYVRPYVRRNKTDRTDTEAMLEADRCAGGLAGAREDDRPTGAASVASRAHAVAGDPHGPDQCDARALARAGLSGASGRTDRCAARRHDRR